MKNWKTYLGLLMLVVTSMGVSLQASEPAKEMELKVYPNPSNGKFTIEFEKELGVMTTARIYDMTGKLVKDFQDDIRRGDRKVRLEVRLENSTSGIYFLKIKSGKEGITQKIVVR